MKFLQLLVLVCLASFAFADVIVDEGFEGGVLPTGWQIWEEGESGCSEWELSPMSPHTGSWCVWHSDASSAMSSSWLVTDTYDMSTYSTVTYTFWRDLGWQNYYVYTAFGYSITEYPTSSDFLEVIELGDINDYWEEFTGDVSTECAGQQYVTFAWMYVGGYDHTERIDDVLIEGFSTALERDTWGTIKSTF